MDSISLKQSPLPSQDEMTSDTGARDVEFIITPPNPTGSLHLGHAVNLTIQDVLARWYRMNGRAVHWEAALDHGAASTELVMHRELLTRGESIERTPDETKQLLLREIIKKNSRLISEQFQRLRLTADHSRRRSIEDADLQTEFEQCLKELVARDVLYWDVKIESWCYERGQSVATVDYVEASGTRRVWALSYRIGSKELSVEHTEPAYLVDEIGVLVPKDGELAAWDNKLATNPLGRPVRLYAAQVAKPHSLNPAYDETSLRFCKERNLHFSTTIGPFGRMEHGEFAGELVASVREKLLATLQKRQTLKWTSEEPCVVRSCRGTSYPAFPRATAGLFLRIHRLLPDVIAMISEDSVTITPRRHGAALIAWMNELLARGGDSDTRVTRDHLCGSEVSRAVVESAAPFRMRFPLTAYRLDLAISNALWAYYANQRSGQHPSRFEHTNDSITVIGLDILFYWVVPTLCIGLALGRTLPFRRVIVHPLVTDPLGRKMSKSMGNVVNLDDAIEQYGVGALRLCLMACLDAKSDILKLDPGALENISAAVRNVVTQAQGSAVTHTEPAALDLARDLPRIDALLGQLDVGAAARLVVAHLPAMAALSALPRELARRAAQLFTAFTAETIPAERIEASRTVSQAADAALAPAGKRIATEQVIDNSSWSTDQ